ncbi:MAG: peroxiredoxin [Halobacteria archaeon]
MTLEEGEDAPNVVVPNQDGEELDLSFEDPTVLYFYPKDDTPGCTIEAKQFNKELESYQDAGVDVYGVSSDDTESHCNFIDKYDLEFELLADTDEEVIEAFDVGASGGYTDRVTYVLADGEVKELYEDVDPDGHPREVLSNIIETGLASL